MAKLALSTVHDDESCPKCGTKLVIRSREHGLFPGCSQYLVCDYVRPLRFSADGHIVKVLEGQVCPVCGANLALRQGRFGMFIGCSNYPECGRTGFIDKPDEAAITCPQCRMGHLVQRRSHYGKTFHSRDRHPECQSATNFKPIAEECPEYHYPLLIKEKTA